MKMIKNFLSTVAIIMAIIVLNSCSDDGPDYTKMRVSRMDIAGAKAVGFIDTKTGSRADALSSGLYKIDANGNISAVAVYITEDEEGNQTKHESEVRMESAYMANVGNDYIYFSDCHFVDNNGERISGLPWQILVRKTDGKMWNLSWEHTGVYLVSAYRLQSWQFYQDYNGILYYADCISLSGDEIRSIYKFNLKTEPATIEQVTANREIKGPYSVDSKGVICGPVNKVIDCYDGRFYNDRNYFVWQNSGFQDLSSIKLPPIKRDYSNEIEGLVCDGDFHKGFVTMFRGQYYLIRSILKWTCYLNGEHIYPPVNIFLDKAVCNRFSIGNTPGSAVLDEEDTTSLKDDIMTSNYDEYCVISSMATPEYILISGYLYGGQNWITALNPETKEWKWVCETPNKIDFNRSLSYNGRYWIITKQDGDLGAFWFHPGSLESGFVKFATTLPSYMDSSKYEVVDGKVIFSGVNPADSHNVRIVFDLITGEAVTDDEAPEYLFSTLISLN